MLGKIIRESFGARGGSRVKETTRGVPHYLPSHAGQEDYAILTGVIRSNRPDGPGVPLPPEELRFWKTEEAYLQGGRGHVNRMCQLLTAKGCPMEEAKRILDFGCGAGRMIRHLPAIAPDAECWGVDIHSDAIRWCRHHLSPAMNFAVATTVPHLPFPDNYFDVIYCGSVFTHIEDTEQTWLLELARILAPAGYLYVTIHDEHTIDLFYDRDSNVALARSVKERPVFSENKDRFSMIVLGRGEESQVFYDSQYFRSLVPPMLRWICRVPGHFHYQSAVVLKRKTL